MRIKLGDLRRIVREETKRAPRSRKADSKSPEINQDTPEMPWEQGKKPEKRSHMKESSLMETKFGPGDPETWGSFTGHPNDPRNVPEDEQSGAVTTTVTRNEDITYNEDQDELVVANTVIDVVGTYTERMGSRGPVIDVSLTSATLKPGMYKIIRDESHMFEPGDMIDASELAPLFERDYLDNEMNDDLVDALRAAAPVSPEPDYEGMSNRRRGY